jgi:hypothetical protein
MDFPLRGPTGADIAKTLQAILVAIEIGPHIMRRSLRQT